MLKIKRKKRQKLLSKFRRIKVHFLIITILCASSKLVYAQSSDQQIKVIEQIDPASIDLTKPTLFAVPYTHLDDFGVGRTHKLYVIF